MCWPLFLGLRRQILLLTRLGGHAIVCGRLNGHRCTRQAPVCGAAEEVDLLLGGIKHAAAVLDEEVPPLVLLKAVLKPEIAGLDLAEDLFQLAKRVFKALGRTLRLLGHAGREYRGEASSAPSTVQRQRLRLREKSNAEGAGGLPGNGDGAKMPPAKAVNVHMGARGGMDN